MALTAEHPGVVRWRGSLWLVHPDFVKGTKLDPQPSPRRGGSPWAYLAVALVFGAVVALSAWLPYDVKRQLTGWVPAVDIDSGFTGLASVLAIVVLGTLAWLAYRKPDVPGVVMDSDKVVSAAVFEEVGISVTDDMSWQRLWDLGSPLARLEESSFAAFQASERGDTDAEKDHRAAVRTELHRAERAAHKLGLQPDLSAYREQD